MISRNKKRYWHLLIELAVLIVDAMALIQRYQQLGNSDLCDLERNYLKQLLSMKPNACNCINFVGDRYDVSATKSLKGEERETTNKAR